MHLVYQSIKLNLLRNFGRHQLTLNKLCKIKFSFNLQFKYRQRYTVQFHYKFIFMKLSEGKVY